MSSERIEDIKDAVEEIHLCKATHVESVPLVEMFRGEKVWEGVVEVFAIEDHTRLSNGARNFVSGVIVSKRQAELPVRKMLFNLCVSIAADAEMDQCHDERFADTIVGRRRISRIWI